MFSNLCSDITETWIQKRSETVLWNGHCKLELFHDLLWKKDETAITNHFVCFVEAETMPKEVWPMMKKNASMLLVNQCILITHKQSTVRRWNEKRFSWFRNRLTHHVIITSYSSKLERMTENEHCGLTSHLALSLVWRMTTGLQFYNSYCHLSLNICKSCRENKANAERMRTIQASLFRIYKGDI